MKSKYTLLVSGTLAVAMSVLANTKLEAEFEKAFKEEDAPGGSPRRAARVSPVLRGELPERDSFRIRLSAAM